MADTDDAPALVLVVLGRECDGDTRVSASIAEAAARAAVASIVASDVAAAVASDIVAAMAPDGLGGARGLVIHPDGRGADDDAAAAAEVAAEALVPEGVVTPLCQWRVLGHAVVVLPMNLDRTYGGAESESALVVPVMPARYDSAVLGLGAAGGGDATMLAISLKRWDDALAPDTVASIARLAAARAGNALRACTTGPGPAAAEVGEFPTLSVSGHVGGPGAAVAATGQSLPQPQRPAREEDDVAWKTQAIARLLGEVSRRSQALQAAAAQNQAAAAAIAVSVRSPRVGVRMLADRRVGMSHSCFLCRCRHSLGKFARADKCHASMAVTTMEKW